MAKLPSSSMSFRAAEYPTVDKKLIEALDEFRSDVAEALGGGSSSVSHGNLTLTDNIQCEVVQCRLAHGVATPISLKKLPGAKGAVLLGSDVEIVSDLTATPGNVAGTAQVTAYFQGGAGTANVSFVLFQEGLSGGASKAYGTLIEPVFEHGWGALGGTNRLPRYMKDSRGGVELRGAISGGVIGLSAFTLPPGFRPSGNTNFACASAGAFGDLNINSSGVVVPGVGSNVAFWLDGVYFDTR